MYSGTTLHNKSGNFIGAHQKFDRMARRFFEELRHGSDFPSLKQILHFEGNNGPDGIKRKSIGVDEPWHFWDPTDDDDRRLLDIISLHKVRLTEALREGNTEKASFEAAWLAHAIVDGLTPAHHYPYEEQLVALRGEGIETRDSIKNKAIIKGDTKRQTVSKNWRLWGAKGLMISHFYFEFGVTSTVKPMKFKKYTMSAGEIEHIEKIGFERFLKNTALEIYELNMYGRFLKRGWSLRLARETRTKLAPRIVHAITAAWVLALDESSVS
jgi:mannose-6-phosphate isomerase-like protein (cupin superfamily)